MSTSVSSLSGNFFPSAQNGFTTTTSGSVSSGAATVGLNSVAGYVNGDAVVLVIDPTDASKKQTFTGIVDTSGVQITSVVWTAGTNQSHALGATVVDYETATAWSMVAKGILIGHTQAGVHRADLPLTTPKITTSINDSGGNEVIKTPATASAVNEITVTNAAATGAPSISATGGDSAINLNLRGKGLAKTVTIGAGAATIYAYDYVVSGCVWTADAAGSTKAASMTAGVVVINGNPVTVAAVTARTFTASKDVYVDVLDNGDGTGLLVYTDGTTNAASGALASNSIRLAIVVVGATNIAAAASINQGQEDRVLPIASSIPYSVTDSLGNLICPRDPNRKILGYRQITTTFTVSSATPTLISNAGGTLSVPVIVPTGRKIRIYVRAQFQSYATATGSSYVNIYDTSTAGAVLQTSSCTSATASAAVPSFCEVVLTPATSSKTYVAALFGDGAVLSSFGCGATSPAHIVVELV